MWTPAAPRKISRAGQWKRGNCAGFQDIQNLERRFPCAAQRRHEKKRLACSGRLRVKVNGREKALRRQSGQDLVLGWRRQRERVSQEQMLGGGTAGRGQGRRFNFRELSVRQKIGTEVNLYDTGARDCSEHPFIGCPHLLISRMHADK